MALTPLHWQYLAHQEQAHALHVEMLSEQGKMLALTRANFAAQEDDDQSRVAALDAEIRQSLLRLEALEAALLRAQARLMASSEGLEVHKRN